MIETIVDGSVVAIMFIWLGSRRRSTRYEKQPDDDRYEQSEPRARKSRSRERGRTRKEADF
jgi:hypothetical protein